jgi:hypothetical protein
MRELRSIMQRQVPLAVVSLEASRFDRTRATPISHTVHDDTGRHGVRWISSRLRFRLLGYNLELVLNPFATRRADTVPRV